MIAESLSGESQRSSGSNYSAQSAALDCQTPLQALETYMLAGRYSWQGREC
jgi:hypothetical protein